MTARPGRTEIFQGALIMRMTRPSLGALALAASVAAVLAAPPARAADATTAVGTWDIQASTPDGSLPSVMTIKQVDGALKAEIEINGLKQAVSDEKLQEGVFSMKVLYDGTIYEVEAKVDGDAMEGTWQGGGNSGTLKAKRRP
jgi:hypothetical protein